MRTPHEGALWDFATEFAPLRGGWIFAYEDGDSPQQPYGTIQLVSVEHFGRPAMYEVNPEVPDIITERFDQHVGLTVSFQVIGLNAWETLRRLAVMASRLGGRVGSPLPGKVFLGFMSSSGPRDLTNVSFRANEPRAQADFRFTARFLDDAPVGTIRQVDVTGAGATQTVEVP